MSEKQISAIESVTLNTATFTEETFTPTFINFFYGKNGAGKTSLGRQLGACEGVKWAEGEGQTDYDILLYNQDFIDAHFRLLDNLKGIFTIREDHAEETERQLTALEEDRKKLEKRLKEIESDRERYKATLQTAEKDFEEACLRNTKYLRTKYAAAFLGASRNPALARKINDTEPKDCDEAELEKRYKAIFSEDEKHMVSLLPPLDPEKYIDNIPSCPLLAEPILPKGTTEFAGFVSALQNLWWVEKGHDDFQAQADGLCPYCHQPLPEDFDAMFASCYDNEYQEKRQKITSFQKQYITRMGDIYNQLQDALNAPLPPQLEDHRAPLKLLVDEFVRAMSVAALTIDRKLQNPAEPAQLEDLAPMLREINAAIEACNAEIDNYNRFVMNLVLYKQKCKNDVWALAAYRLQGEKELIQSIRSHALAVSEALTAEESEARKNLSLVRGKLKELGAASTTVQEAVDAMNRILRDSGFEGFEIVRSDFAKDAYMVVREDKQIAARLSEGEQHFLSFLYFYHLVKGYDASGVRRKKIVIIDDPVSSLDGTNLYLICSLVREMIEVCYNNADYRGQTVKGDYIRQLFILTHNARFHKGITLSQVSRFACVSFFKINKVGNHSSITWCKRQSRTKAGEEENYNPVKNAYAALWSEYLEVKNEIPLMNVIRRILDFYFLELCAKDGLDLREEILIKQRDKFVTTRPDGSEDRTLFQLADSMLQYMGAGDYGEMDFVSDGADVEEIRSTFEMIFRRLGHGAHYDMMLERARLA